MAITPIATASADAGSGNVSITHGLTIVAGDVLTAFINVNGTGNTATDNNGSTAFTETTHGDQPPAGSAVMYIFERVAGSSEPSSYAWTLGSSDRWSIVICQDRGVDASIWDVVPSGANIATDDTGGTTSTCPAITIATSGALGRVAMGDDFNPTTTTFSSVNNSYTLSRSESGQQYIVVAEKASLSTGSTGTTVITSSSTVRTVQWQMALKPSTGTVEQEGFRWGVDDGNEASHTWEAAQDTNISIASGQSRLLRDLLNTTGDYASSAFKLKYQKNGSGGYTTVPIGATGAGTQPLIEAADCTVSGSNTAAASWAVSHPAASTGDLLIFYIAWDDSTATTDVTEPAGVNGETLTEINATPITDTATETRAKAWYCICTGSWTATTRTFTPSATESWSATVVRVPAGEFDSATPIGTTGTRTTTGTADTSVLSVAMTAGASDGGGTLLWFAGVDTDPLTGTITGWTILQQQDLGAVAHGVAKRNTAVSNSESIAGGDTWTIAGDSWTSIGVIVRAPIVNNETYITTSANITAGGEATTARLTAPSGKTTSDFVTGRRWDDENGSDATDITTDDYSEFEWLVALKSGLADSTYFDYRIYNGDVALDTYTTTARWTVSGSVTITLDTATITALGRALTLVPGAVSKTLSTASLSATGRAFTVVPGAFSLLLDTASLSATGRATTIIPGAATTLLDTAALLANGQALTVVPGAFTLTLDTATLTAAGQIIQVGNINTILLDTATLSANGQAVTLLPGAISTLLDTALLTLNGQAFTVIPGASTRILSTALLSASGQVLDVIPGAVTKTLSTALLSALGQGATLVPGAVTIAMDTAQINASGIAITIQSVGGAVTVILDTATLLAGGIALDVIPGDISTLLDTAQLTASGIQSSIIPGGVIIGLDTAALLANGQGLTLDVILQAVIRAWTLRERDTAWTLENRATGWTLRNRDTEWSLDDRDTDWSLRGRKTDWTIDDR